MAAVPTQSPGFFDSILQGVQQVLGPSIPAMAPPAQPQGTPAQQPGFLDSVGQGIQSRNLLPALALGGLISLLPPLLYSKQHRGAAARAYGGIGTQLGMHELQRPEREAARKQAQMGTLMQGGYLTPTQPGGKEVGKIAGQSFGMVPTLAESYPELLSTGVPPGRGGTDWKTEDSTLGTQDVTSAYMPPTAQAPSLPLQILGQLPASPANKKVLADVAQKQYLTQQETANRGASKIAIKDWAKRSGGYAVPGIDSKGRITYRGQMPSAGSSSEIDKMVALKGPMSNDEQFNLRQSLRSTGTGRPSRDEQAIVRHNQARAEQGQGPMGPADEEEFLQRQKPPSFDDKLVKMTANTNSQNELRDLRRALSDREEALESGTLKIPAQYKAMTQDAKQWQDAMKDPNLAIDEGVANKILGLIQARDKARHNMELWTQQNSQAPGAQGAGSSQEHSRTDPGMMVHDLLRKFNGQAKTK